MPAPHRIVSLPRAAILLPLLITFALCRAAFAADRIDFAREVVPIFVSHCTDCHSGAEPKGGLSLIEPDRFAKGGESGMPIAAGNPDASLLWRQVSTDEMPPKHPLGDADKATLRQWIEEGANWSGGPIDPFAISTSTRAGRDWWSLKPIQAHSPIAADHTKRSEADHPQTRQQGARVGWARKGLDHFILDRLHAAGLTPSPEATPRELARRVAFDLTGLPPTPQQIAAFASDPSDESYAKLVDELLDSPHYGERWGRHWLDVVRFGESDGFERNFPREHAWHYRDWVIKAFNAGMPYDEFVRMQLIGDLMTDDLDGKAALGFWVAGVHNTVVGGSDRMRALAREDEIEEVLGTLGQTFLGLTINCARCHDHKFDPISQREYYQLAATIGGIGHGETDQTIPEEAAKLAALDQELHTLRETLATIDRDARQAIRNSQPVTRDAKATDQAPAPLPIARWDFTGDLKDSIGGLHGVAHGRVKVEAGALLLDGSGFVSTPPIPQPITTKTLEAWVEVTNPDQRGGGVMTIEDTAGNLFDSIVYGEQEPKKWMPGSNNFLRTASFEGEDESEATTRTVHLAWVYLEDGTILAYRDGVRYGKDVRKGPLQPFGANECEVLFGLRHRPVGGNRSFAGKLHRASLYDRALSPEEIAASGRESGESITEAMLVESLTPDQRSRRVSLQAKLGELSTARQAQAARATRKLYTLTPGPVPVTRVLLRGDPATPGDIVNPAGVTAIDGPQPDFDLPPDAPESVRRQKLADWITSPANPLFARVMVNRVWHHHFGAGIVDTTSDFGFGGSRPSHPELLDHLAARFRDGGYDLKSLHRTIVTSSTYRQSYSAKTGDERTRCEAIDADSRLLWRGHARRLEAEAVRDAMLVASGTLNPTVGGAGYKDVAVTHNNGTTYYDPIEVTGSDFYRRTVYRFNPRGGRSGLLDNFDCPDTATSAPRRSVTTTPLQALSLLNNGFVLEMATAMAKRLRAEAGDDLNAQVNLAWELAIARKPAPDELELSIALARQHGLEALCRGLFNTNEFLIIE